MTNWISTKEDLPPEFLKVVARNPYAESVSWIDGVTETGKPRWMHKYDWEHADDYVTEGRFLTLDEIYNHYDVEYGIVKETT